MRTLFALTAVIVAATMMGGTSTANAEKVKYKCPGVIKGIHYYRQATWEWQDKLGLQRTRVAWQKFQSCKFAHWTARRWMKRAHAHRAKYLAHVRFLRRLNSDPKAAICYVFGRYCGQALAVSGCETGGTYSLYAKNGQYLGIFQMGEHERATYGHGSTYLEQARAAYRYFVASGKDWSPWTCRFAIG